MDSNWLSNGIRYDLGGPAHGIVTETVHKNFSHSAGSSEISAFYEGFTMMVYEKIYFKAYTNGQYISHENNIAQLCFILGTFL